MRILSALRAGCHRLSSPGTIRSEGMYRTTEERLAKRRAKESKAGTTCKLWNASVVAATIVAPSVSSRTVLNTFSFIDCLLPSLTRVAFDGGE